ncbi:cellulase family glycosylhydrolase [Candidatus Bathyarchaeota archaeon]|nr:cellulase family glycosylhydrolase [Candidatus Bathyarchaeota archaeon]
MRAILALILTLLTQSLAKPAVPLSSESRWVVDANGHRLKLRCINWAAHLEPNIPEGLHKRSAPSLASWIVSNGFNCVRLTYSTDMALNPSLPVRDSFLKAAAETGAPEGDLLALYDRAAELNPIVGNGTVREVFDYVIDTLWEEDIMTILDNHVSKASWCCNLDDGNGWWSDALVYSATNSRFFDTDTWLAGLQATALWTRGNPAVVGLALRNEPRATWTQFLFAPSTWYSKMSAAARIVHEANPDALVVIAGLNGGADLSPLRAHAMDTGDWADKHVWESHEYPFTVTTPDLGSCEATKANYGLLYGFVLEQGRTYTGPLWLSEFGVNMQGGPNDGLSDGDLAYLTCLVSYMESNDADWALWALQGSYYVRDGVVDKDESWGALDRDWGGWRNPKFRELLGGMFEVTQGP